MVPYELRDAVDRMPRTGAWADMLPLLTVDEAGYPHVCLLSSAELAADEAHVYAVIAAPATIGNLLRTRQATLIVVTDDTAVYTKLDVTHVVQGDGRLGATFRIATVKRDGIGVPLAPPRYLVTPEIESTEDWTRSARLIEDLRHHATEGTPS